MSHISGDQTSVDVIMGVTKLDLEKPLPSYENFSLSMEHSKEYEKTLNTIFYRAKEGYTDAYIGIELPDEIIKFFTNKENGFKYKKIGSYNSFDWYNPEENTIAKKLQKVTERYQHERIVKAILKKRDTDNARYLHPELTKLVEHEKLLEAVEVRLNKDGFKVIHNTGETIVQLNK